jgi:hypothetical protein
MVDIGPRSQEQVSRHRNIEKAPAIKVAAMPGKYVPPGVLGTLNIRLYASLKAFVS